MDEQKPKLLRIVGKAAVIRYEFCECEHCEGHRRSAVTMLTKVLPESQIRAYFGMFSSEDITEEHCREYAEHLLADPREPDDAMEVTDWITFSFAEYVEPGEDVKLRQAGYPELFVTIL